LFIKLENTSDDSQRPETEIWLNSTLIEKRINQYKRREDEQHERDKHRINEEMPSHKRLAKRHLNDINEMYAHVREHTHMK